MANVWEYVRAVYRHWVTAVTSTIVAVFATAWGLSGGRALTTGALAGISVTLFAVASYQAWMEKRGEAFRWKTEWARLKENLNNASVVVDFLLELNGWWQRGCAVNTPESAEQWRTEYREAFSGLKERFKDQFGRDKMVSLLEIRNAHKAPAIPSCITEGHAREMGFLAHHMARLEDELRECHRVSRDDSLRQPPSRA